MSMEKNYSKSYGDDDYIVSVLEGLAVHTDWHIQKVKNEIAGRFFDNHLDLEYINLYIDEMNVEIQMTILKKILTLKNLSQVKYKDFQDRHEKD